MQFILIFCFPVSATGKEYIIGTAVFVSLHMNCCKTLYFRCILISRFWNVAILLHFNLAFSQCFTSIYQAFDEQTECSQIYLILRFYPTREMRENLMHAKNTCSQYILRRLTALNSYFNSHQSNVLVTNPCSRLVIVMLKDVLYT